MRATQGMVVVTCAAIALQPFAVAADESAIAAQGKKYSSPKGVFEAYRRAVAAGDWRTVYYCWSPKDRRALIFEAYFSLETQPDDPDVHAIRRDFNVDESAIEIEYRKRHKEKYGSDLAKTSEASATQPTIDQRKSIEPKPGNGPVPGVPNTQAARSDNDLELVYATVEASIADGAGFYVAVSKLLAKRNPDMKTPIGPLERIDVRSNEATGTASTTLFHYEGPQMKKVGQRMQTPFHFRKVGDGWFLEIEAKEQR